MFDQEEKTINRLMVIYQHLDEWRDLEMKKLTAATTTSGEH